MAVLYVLRFICLFSRRQLRSSLSVLQTPERCSNREKGEWLPVTLTFPQLPRLAPSQVSLLLKLWLLHQSLLALVSLSLLYYCKPLLASLSGSGRYKLLSVPTLYCFQGLPYPSDCLLSTDLIVILYTVSIMASYAQCVCTLSSLSSIIFFLGGALFGVSMCDSAQGVCKALFCLSQHMKVS